MPKYRNVSGDDRFQDVPGRGLVLVEADAVVEIPDVPGYYVQTGEQGETPLWELVESTQSDTSKGEK